MKKIIIALTLCAAMCAAFSLPSSALETTPDIVAKVPSTYATVKGGEIVYNKSATAYSPDTFNAILEAYGLSLSADALGDVPSTYATANGGEVAFGKKAAAYSPDTLHKILTAYGLTLSPEDVSAKLGSTTYAKVVDGEIVFGNKATAYSGDELAAILSAYQLPYAAPTTPATPATPATPTTPTTPAPPVTTGPEAPVPGDKCPGTPIGAVVDERGCWVLNADYLFDFDKATIRPEYYKYLDDVVTVINNNPNLDVEIQGHTCSIGTEAYNQGLSERRARSVKKYLVSKGIAASRLTTVGFGETKPAVSNATREGRAKNRRVEFNPIWK